MAATFIIDRAPDQQFYFTLQSDRGETLLVSVPFVFRISLLSAIDQVRKYAPEEKYFHKAIAVNQEHFFILRSPDEELLGTSEFYPAASWRDDAQDAVRREAPAASVDDRTK